MTSETRDIIVARARSFSWRLGCFLAVQAIGYIGNSLAGINLPQPVLVLIAYGLGELTKYINDHTALFGAARKG